MTANPGPGPSLRERNARAGAVMRVEKIAADPAAAGGEMLCPGSVRGTVIGGVHAKKTITVRLRHTAAGGGARIAALLDRDGDDWTPVGGYVAFDGLEQTASGGFTAARITKMGGPGSDIRRARPLRIASARDRNGRLLRHGGFWDRARLDGRRP